MAEHKEFQALAQRILTKAARELGGAGPLATFLGVSEAMLAEWIAGKEVPPAEVVLKAVIPLADKPLPALANIAVKRPAPAE